MTTDFIKAVQPLLTKSEERALFKAWHDERDSNPGSRRENRLFEKIIIQYSPIVKRLVHKMRGYKMDNNEMLSEALMALSKAAIDFKPDLDFRFATYAINCITGTLFTYVTKNYFITNVCATNGKNKKLFFNLRRVMAQQIKESGSSELTPEMARELATNFDVSVDAVLTMNSLLREPYQSLNQQLGEDGDGATREDMLVSYEVPQEDRLGEEQTTALRKQLMQDALEILDERSRYILVHQSLQEPGEVITLEDLGTKYNISKERARQIRDRAKMRIKAEIKNRLRQIQVSPSDLVN